jgi:hypothetical protein
VNKDLLCTDLDSVTVHKWRAACYRQPDGDSCGEFFTTYAFYHQFLPGEPRSS